MTPFADVRAGGAPGLIRWVCTKNPFYVLSAALFLAGLWVSFGDPAKAEDTWAMMSGLAGYTLLLAVTACLLVRFGQVWDDVRTVLLLVVLLFLATSVTFDEVLVLDPARGRTCALVGLLLAVVVTEGVLRGMRLRLPAGFRVPYYLILALFFLYPLALGPLVSEPRSEALMWGLFGFSPAAGLVFLTLLPAVRRGPDYVRANGSPWSWPLYPGTLFAVLAFAVPARAFLLCWSLHLLDGPARLHSSIFGLYFIVPFGLAVALLLLEMGLVSRHRGVVAAALIAPAILAVLALAGHRADPVYQSFLEAFTARLGGSPLFLTLLAAVGYYAWAAARRAPRAFEALTGTLVALAFVGPHTLGLDSLIPPAPAPLLAAGALYLGLGAWRRESWRSLAGAGGLVLAVVLVLPVEPEAVAIRGLIALHLLLTAVLIVGAVFDDAFARLLRAAGAGLVLLACLAVIVVRLDAPSILPRWEADAYPLILAALLAVYGVLLGHRPSLGMATVVLSCWVAATGWRGYCFLRQLVSGLDYLAVSLAIFALAVLVSVGKSGLLARWAAARQERLPSSTD